MTVAAHSNQDDDKDTLDRKFEMKKNVLSSMFGFGVILMSLFLLASRRPREEAAAAALLEAVDSVDAITSIDYEQAADVSAACTAMPGLWAGYRIKRVKRRSSLPLIGAVPGVSIKLAKSGS